MMKEWDPVLYRKFEAERTRPDRELLARIIWRTSYYHVMADAQAIISWLQATGLRPFLATLDEAAQTAFPTDYHQRLLTAYPAQVDGQVLLAFPRFFMVAVKKR